MLTTDTFPLREDTTSGRMAVRHSLTTSESRSKGRLTGNRRCLPRA